MLYSPEKGITEVCLEEVVQSTSYASALPLAQRCRSERTVRLSEIRLHVQYIHYYWTNVVSRRKQE